MSFAEPLIKDLKGKGLRIFVSADYGEFDKGCGDEVPEDAAEGHRCVGVYVAVRQDVMGPKSEHNQVSYSVLPDLSVDVIKISAGAEKAITSYLEGLGYKKISFR